MTITGHHIWAHDCFVGGLIAASTSTSFKYNQENPALYCLDSNTGLSENRVSGISKSKGLWILIILPIKIDQNSNFGGYTPFSNTPILLPRRWKTASIDVQSGTGPSGPIGAHRGPSPHSKECLTLAANLRYSHHQTHFYSSSMSGLIWSGLVWLAVCT